MILAEHSDYVRLWTEWAEVDSVILGHKNQQKRWSIANSWFSPQS